MNLSFYLFVFVINQGNDRGGESKISSCYPRCLGDSHQTYRERDDAIKCVWSICKWLNQWWLVFVLLEVDATLDAECVI